MNNDLANECVRINPRDFFVKEVGLKIGSPLKARSHLKKENYEKHKNDNTDIVVSM